MNLIPTEGHRKLLKNRIGHVVALVEANPKEYVEKGRFTVDKKNFPTWAHPVVANGKLYLRDMSTLTSYRVLD